MKIFFHHFLFLFSQSLNTQLLWLQHIQTAKVTGSYLLCARHSVKGFTYTISFNLHVALHSSYDPCFQDGKAEVRKIKWPTSGQMAIKKDSCPGLITQSRFLFYHIPFFFLQHQPWKTPKVKRVVPTIFQNVLASGKLKRHKANKVWFIGQRPTICSKWEEFWGHISRLKYPPKCWQLNSSFTLILL